METINPLSAFHSRPSFSSFLSPDPRVGNHAAQQRTPLALSIAFALAIPGAGVGLNAFAQQAPAEPIPVFVTATRTAQSVNDVLAQITVIRRDDIVNAGAASLTELLQRRAGLDIRATGGPGQTSGVFIRGTNATHTLVLVDGQRIASSTSGAAALEHLSLDAIERIEVVRGPLSGLYGSDAIGGVIQIFTRNPAGGQKDAVGGNASLGGGSFGTRAADAAFFAAHGDTRFSITASTRRVDAPSATNPLAGSFTYNPDRDPYRNTSATVKLSHTLWQGETVSLSAWQSDGKVHFDSGLGNDAENHQTLAGWQLASDNTFTDFWTSRLSVGETKDDSRVSSNFPSQFKTTQKQLAWQNNFATRAGDAVLGFERREEEVASTTRFTTQSRTTDAVFASISQRVEGNTLEANARHDREDQFGSRTTGGVTWGIQWDREQRIYFSAGKAFRAPSFNDLYFPGFSNDKLRPEKSTSGEFGWRYDDKRWKLNLAVFENRIDDLVVFDSVTFKPQNIRRAQIRGWEFEAVTRAFNIDWRARLTSQDPKDADSDKQLRSRAKRLGSIAAETRLGAWQFGVDLSATGKRYDSTNEAPASRMGGYTLVGAFARYRVNREWSVDLIGNNLGGKRYELAKGYEPLGRQLQASVRLSF